MISGAVTATRPLVTEPATTVAVREQGSVVSVAQVRSDFEGKLGRKLTDEELVETVDYSLNGIEHAQVGDRVLVVVADDASVQNEGAYVSLARLVGGGAEDGLSKAISTKFT
ncbi:hypothetical protein [Streptomyces gardneri]|uniref:hypothetical protein n=1 Tax=Streptomyces gardneri TaxID=66892 RepID=UPI00369C1146